jgi:Flp pilus assembly protein CpaB
VQDGSRRRARLILIVGVALALVAGVGTFVYASGARSDVPEAVPTVAVLVAAREIPAKTTLTAADVKVQDFNLDSKPAAAMSSPDEAPLANSPNFRAMSITVADQNAVGGTVQPGDLVDMVFTLQFDPATKLQRPTPQQTVDFSSKIILERLPILARLASVYTIRVDSLTAERIAYLQSSGGQIAFLLRAPKDERASGSIGATFRDIHGTFNIKIPEKIQ